MGAAGWGVARRRSSSQPCKAVIVSVMRELIVLFLAAALLPCDYVRAQQPPPAASPIQLTFSGHFEPPVGSTAVYRAIKSVGQQIDAKRAANAARSPLWDLAIWRYLPTDPGRTLNSPVASADDPFFTPEYLKVSARQMDYQLKKLEKASQNLLR